MTVMRDSGIHPVHVGGIRTTEASQKLYNQRMRPNRGCHDHFMADSASENPASKGSLCDLIGMFAIVSSVSSDAQLPDNLGVLSCVSGVFNWSCRETLERTVLYRIDNVSCGE